MITASVASLFTSVASGNHRHLVRVFPHMSVTSLLTLLLGVLLGAVVGFLSARNREAGARTDLTARTTAAEERARAAEQRAALVDGQLAERLQALSVQAVDASTRRFLEMAEGRLGAANAKAAGQLETRRAAVESLVGPLKETLARVETQLRESDAQRRASHAALTEQVGIARQSSEELKRQTQALVTALRRPEARGRWGEMQLRRVVELAGMSARCDFDEQVAVASADGPLRPDMVVRLAGGKNIVVDSKVSLAAYLEAAESSDEAVRDARIGAHARHVREHVDRLAAKAYWAALSPAPEFVVLFIPGEAFLAPALERDPGLLEYAVSRRVHIATPTTLVSMLRTAQYAWQQAALSDNARAVFELGRELYDRLCGLGQHVDRLGRALTSAVKTYNQAVGSLESRVLVSARRLNQVGLVDAALETPELIEESVRMLSAPELTAATAPELTADLPAGLTRTAATDPASEIPGELTTAAATEPASEIPPELTTAALTKHRRPAVALLAAHRNGAAK
jgi:DNA recombination protein RmuC